MTVPRRAARPALLSLLVPLVAAAAPGDRPPPAVAEAAAVVVGIPGPGRAAPAPMTLDACIAAALEGDIGLRQVRRRDREISGQGLQAMATGLPTVDAVGTWTRSRDPSFLLDDSFGGGDGSDIPDSLLGGIDFSAFLPDPDDLEAQTFWRGSLTSNWELNPFRVWNALEGVSVTRAKFEADLRAEEHRVVDETIRTFQAAVYHHEVLAALDAEVAARAEFLGITRRRFRLELSTELDTLRAAVSLANLRPERRRAATELHRSASSLNRLMGRDPMDPLALAPVADVETGPIDPSEALRAADVRPDVASARQDVRFLRKRRGVERADRKPFLSADGSWGWVARDLDGLVDREYEAWSASVSLIVPLFDGLSVTGRSRELDARIESAEDDVEDRRRAARLEVATTLRDLEAARENLEAARLNLDAAERALERTTLRYDLGTADYLTLLNAQSERFSARSHLIEARREVLSTTSALKRAMGFDPRTPLAAIRDQLEESSP